MTAGNDDLGVNEGVDMHVYMRRPWEILNLIVINDWCACPNTILLQVIVFFHAHIFVFGAINESLWAGGSSASLTRILHVLADQHHPSWR